MIISASRRTDIPAYYSKWFINRIKAGYVDVRNPMNAKHISRLSLERESVDCIIFWTKNAKPIIPLLSEIKDYPFYFLFSVNPYNQDIEKNVPRKKHIFDAFKKLSDTIGPEKVIWRYDPILLSDTIDIDYHIKYFETIAAELKGYTDQCIFSFMESYQKTKRNTHPIGARELTEKEVKRLAPFLKNISGDNEMNIQMCASKYDLSEFGINNGSCIDRSRIERITGKTVKHSKDKNQREGCECLPSVDIGEYNTCLHNCLYCYANYSKQSVQRKAENHNMESSLLTGNISEEDIIKIRRLPSVFEDQLRIL